MKQIRQLRLKAGVSEAALAAKAGVSRLTLRHVESGDGNPTLGSLRQISSALEGEFVTFLAVGECHSDFSTVAVSQKVVMEGFESWPIHFMEMVDEFRKRQDLRLLLLPPVSGLEARLKALLASIVLQLCLESQLEPPYWATRSYFLSRPWFVSETENLKALAIRDSPWAFRKNNIFVQDNFLARA